MKKPKVKNMKELTDYIIIQFSDWYEAEGIRPHRFMLVKLVNQERFSNPFCVYCELKRNPEEGDRDFAFGRYCNGLYDAFEEYQNFTTKIDGETYYFEDQI